MHFTIHLGCSPMNSLTGDLTLTQPQPPAALPLCKARSNKNLDKTAKGHTKDISCSAWLYYLWSYSLPIWGRFYNNTNHFCDDVNYFNVSRHGTAPGVHVLRYNSLSESFGNKFKNMKWFVITYFQTYATPFHGTVFHLFMIISQPINFTYLFMKSSNTRTPNRKHIPFVLLIMLFCILKLCVLLNFTWLFTSSNCNVL